MESPEVRQREELMEARRLRRMEQAHRRKFQQRLVLLILCVILALSAVLILRGCRSRQAQQDAPAAAQADDFSQLGVETEPDIVFTLAAVGDITVDDEQLAAALQEDGSYDFTESFAAVSGLTSAADLTLGNLECTFAGQPYSGAPDFRTPESLAATLQAVGFDVLQTANTYSIRSGLSGLQATHRVLTAAGVDHTGTYDSAAEREQSGGVLLKTVGGVKIAIVSATKGLDGLLLPEGSEYAVDVLYQDYDSDFEKLDTASLLASVDAARAQKPDIILALLHWGSAGELAVTDRQRKLAQTLFENGVDAVIGSHSHLVGPMEQMTVTTNSGKEKTCFVAYSLGSFFAGRTGSYGSAGADSVLLNLQFTKNGQTGETSLTGVSYTPLYLADLGEEAKTRFEILPVRSAIASGLFPELNDAMTNTISRLRTNTASDFDSGR